MVEFVNYVQENGMYKFIKVGKFKFSYIELKHLFIAMIMIILTIFVFNNKSMLSVEGIFSMDFLYILTIYCVTIGFGFLFHEMGHKLVAQHYGFVSEFRADFQMLFMMFVLALVLPIIFLAPGAVMILGRPSIRQNGIISVAGPLVNLILALIFTVIGILFSPVGIFGQMVWLGVMVNAFLGLFNMLPIWILDGKKVFRWNKPVYFLVLFSLLFFLFF